ncbi:hypothetical protein ON058_05585 [Demequina sp. B12]|uniref:VOC family protein n=1 Tax=Demequina sp. B12 TaxID=2992757 RepID=UPI00237A5C4B|nr:VOC family protein [Demequina sp. B12]MDE0572885.1 hypothetical protein [Demequina sp. B12]
METILLAEPGSSPSNLKSTVQNYATEHEVDERLQAAIAAGATHLKAPTAAPWGRNSGYFADPDGHVWELAVNPYWELGDDGRAYIPQEPPEP